MTIKTLMLPHISHFRTEESGIKRVVEAYFKYLPDYDIELVSPDATSYDVKAVHAGMTSGDCDVAHLHGMYFTADYDAARWEYDANSRIVEALRYAKEVTVPSSWVAETFQRDMRFSPHVIGHGIEWDEWQHNEDNYGFVLWNKNRAADVCSPAAFDYLSREFPEVNFISTFGTKRENTHIFNGIVPHADMKKLVQQAGVYLSTAKETFGIGVLEAMASGVPVLGWRNGGNVQLVEHGTNGYLATPNDYEDLAEGLRYCLNHHNVLGDNGREMAKAWTWQAACEKVAGVYRLAMEDEPAMVSVVIPVYNKPIEQVTRAIDSCLKQTLPPEKIIVVDDGSSEGIPYSMEFEDYLLDSTSDRIEVVYQDNQGVANARNNGISLSNNKYICCLDSDDWLEPTFIETCVGELEEDRSLGIAFTGLKWHSSDGESAISDWPADWDFDRQVNYKARQNQVPTCCVFRREMWQRLGGYRQRYAPQGAGAEDAEFWTRAGAYGWKAKKVTEEPLFNYSLGGQVGSNPDYREVDWLAWHPWSKDNQHPLASYATPAFKSHPVRQYDEPVVSVIIPVGPGHEKVVINALDSLEAQTFRKWEAIVVDDTLHDDLHDKWYYEAEAYPYVRWVRLGGYGAGYARNRGVEIARAPFILFLDADDTLHPEAIEKMLQAWSETGEGVYTDYVGQAFIDGELAAKLDREGRLQSFNPKDGEAIITYQSPEFNCERALRQPNESKPYIWLITTLIPKAWHDEIGGFDEGMETWEDWDYWLRHVRNGKCFRRLPEELVRYRLYTGRRRDSADPNTEEGRQKALFVIEYLKEKYESIGDMGCGCKKQQPKQQQVMANQNGGSKLGDGDFTRAKYIGRRGNHHIIGAFEFDRDPGLPSKRRGNKWVIYYGYNQHGFETLVHNEDVRIMVGKWQPLVEIQKPPKIETKPLGEPVALPQMKKALEEAKTDRSPMPDLPEVESVAEGDMSDMVKPLHLEILPGVTPTIAERMREAGLTTVENIRIAGFSGLMNIKGVAEARARAILKAVEEK